MRYIVSYTNYYNDMEKTMEIRYWEYDGVEELKEEERALVAAAREATGGSYSPYSHFKVGAAVLLEDGSVVKGSNQENVAYPSGLCAERVTLFSASAQSGGKAVRMMAVTAIDGEGKSATAAPCGACRQVMAEQERRQGSKMRIIVPLGNGKIRIFDSADDLLPFAFEAELG